MDCALPSARKQGLEPISGREETSGTLQGAIHVTNENINALEDQLHMWTQRQEQANNVRQSEFEHAVSSTLQPLVQQLDRFEEHLHSAAMSQASWTSAQKNHLESLTHQSRAMVQLLSKHNEESKLADSLIEARHHVAASDQRRIDERISSLPEMVAQKVLDVLLEKLPERLLVRVPEQQVILPPPLGSENNVASHRLETQQPQTSPSPPTASKLLQIPQITPDVGLLATASEEHLNEEEYTNHDQDECLDVDLNIDMQAKANYGKLSMSEDHAIDVSGLKLQEESSLASVFTTVTDPELPPYNVEEYYKKRGVCQALARSHHFANLTVFIVFLNAVYLGVDSDYNDAANLYDAKLPFLITTQFFCTYFTGELLIRLFAFEHMKDCFRDGWFKFDLFLVASMILDTWIIMPYLKILSGSAQVAIPTQPLRMLRLFKLTRMARLMKSFPELVTMIKALVRALRAIASSFLLIIVMLYTWAILTHMLLKDQKEYNSYVKSQYDYEFTKIHDCMWTMFLAGTLMLDNASPLMRSLLYTTDISRFLAGLAFISYCFLSALLILQMLIGVLCDVVSNVTAERKDAECIGLVRQQLLGDLKKHDDGDGKLSRAEFEGVMETEGSKATLKKLNINRPFLLEVASMMFPDSTAQVPIRSVLDVMLMCKGDNVVTVQVIASALCYLTNELNSLQEKMVLHMRVTKPHATTSSKENNNLSKKDKTDLISVLI